jgi:amidase
MATWIERLDGGNGPGPRVAVKDAIDVEGVPTTVGCAAVADVAEAATADADLVTNIRAGGGRIVGKANLHELCFSTAGTNPWFGNPVNPLAPDLLPGGSSSGSAVAVATGEADIGIGTDTGGSVRLPAACCGLVGLKTTWGRISLGGVWPLSPTLDTIGPLARDLDGVVAGMRLLEPGFDPSSTSAATVVGRVRGMAGVDVDPAMDADVDRFLAEAGFEVVEIELPGLAATGEPFAVVILTEAWTSDRHLMERAPERIGDDIRNRLQVASGFSQDLVPGALEKVAAWKAEVRSVFDRVELLAMPTLVEDPPPVGADGVPNPHVFPWNLAGVPALSMPIGERRPIPTSLQLIAPWGGEEVLCATAARLR